MEAGECRQIQKTSQITEIQTTHCFYRSSFISTSLNDKIIAYSKGNSVLVYGKKEDNVLFEIVFFVIFMYFLVFIHPLICQIADFRGCIGVICFLDRTAV